MAETCSEVLMKFLKQKFIALIRSAGESPVLLSHRADGIRQKLTHRVPVSVESVTEKDKMLVSGVQDH